MHDLIVLTLILIGGVKHGTTKEKFPCFSWQTGLAKQIFADYDFDTPYPYRYI